MHKKQITVILIIAVSVILFFVLFFGIKNAKSERIIETALNKNFTISLVSNPTTGYQWQIVRQMDTGLLELLNSKFIAPETNLVGAPGHEEWSFKAIKKGKTIISFAYSRPWEKDELPVQIETFIIIIK